MAAPDPSAGGTFIWVISTVLFLSLAAGGGCLVLYIIQPDSHYASWLPFVGVALVCLPWLFWMLTCLYRVISRTCGVRVATSGGGGGRGGGGSGAFDQGGSARANVVNNNNNNNNNNNATAAVARVEASPRIVETLPVRSPESEARRRAQFEAILALDEEDEEEVKDKKKSRSSSNHSSTDLSMASHESEMPLALSMAS